MSAQDLDQLLPTFIAIPAALFRMGTPERDLSALAKAYGGTRESYREARDALAIAERVERFGRIAGWDELGAYRTLARFPLDATDTALHPGLLKLLSDPANAPFVDTLEAYLDLAGDAKATAEALTLHRATLYYRLNRIEEITGARLKTGDDRLALHLGLRLARLAGLR